VATWNTGAERLKGYAEAEVIGRSVEMFYRPEDVVAGVPYDELEIATRHDHFSGDGWRMRANGECVRVSTSVHAIRDDDGALVGFSRATRPYLGRRGSRRRRIPQPLDWR
jgi:PAS domain S-box-containing protein